jgi:predicted secreted hydrolase
MGWSSPQIWMGHAALTSADDHFVAERWARGGIGQAGVVAEPFHAWIDGFEMRGPMLGEVTMSAGGERFSYELDLKADRPL